MSTLLLARHAKSAWDHPGLSDHDRPLSPRGERDAPHMAERLRAEGVPLDLIVSSSAVRAHATARAYARGYGIPDHDIVIEPALYAAWTDTILEVADRYAAKNVMLVGHNPGMSGAASQLAGQWLELPTCAVVEFACEAPDAATLAAVRTPKDS